MESFLRNPMDSTRRSLIKMLKIWDLFFAPKVFADISQRLDLP